MANVPTAQVSITGMQDKIVPCNFAIATSAAAGSLLNGTMYPFGLQNPTSVTTFQVPAGSKYQLVDMYTSGTPSVDGQLVVQLNGITQGENLILSTMNAQANSRAKITQGLVLDPTVTLTVQLVTIAANGTAAATDSLYLHFVQVPA
jgi:hypothetical protein